MECRDTNQIKRSVHFLGIFVNLHLMVTYRRFPETEFA